MLYCPRNMQHRTLLSALALCTLMVACKGPDFIRLQPTIEEPPALAVVVRMNDPATSGQLLSGFYALEGNTWRWTGPKFSVALGAPPSAPRKGAGLVFNFDLPDASIAALKKITLTAAVGSVSMPAQTFATAGSHEYRCDVPASAFSQDKVRVDFSLDKSLKPEGDNRDLGVVAMAIGLVAK